MKTSDYEKQTELKQKSFWGIWSKLSIGDYAKDSCSLIWNSFFSIIFFFLWIFPGIFINAYAMWKNKSVLKYWHYSLINMFIFVFGAMCVSGKTLQQYQGHGLEFIYKSYLVGLIFLSLTIAFIVIIVLFIYALSKLWDYIKSKWSKPEVYGEVKQVPMINLFFHNLKKKHCSLINWK